MCKLKQAGIVLGLCGLAASAYSDNTLHVATVDTGPNVDGAIESGWDNAQELIVPLRPIPKIIVETNKKNAQGKYAKKWTETKKNAVTQVSIKAVKAGDEVFFLTTWQDSSEDAQHKPWKWQGDQKSGEYVAGKEREDRIALMFPISGAFSPNKLSGKPMSTDVWHWKAARTNGIGIAHDKSHIVSLETPKGKSASHYTADGQKVYVSRPGDGPSPYSSNNIDPFVFQGEQVPKYLPKRPDDANAADVAAKGQWQDGQWTVEFSRKLDTGHHDSDTVFKVSADTQLAVAVFDHAGDHHHVVSDTVTVVFD